ncbi:MAG: beta-ketoacyl-ACP synthase II [Candidatus Omnitrophota bacterium]
MNDKRVVITGIGLVTPIGIGKDIFWENCLSGKSNIRRITAFDVSEYNCKIASTIDNFDPTQYMDKIIARRSDKFAQFAIAAASMAMEDSRLNNPDPKYTGVCVGTGLGGMVFAETQIVNIIDGGNTAVNPVSIPKIMPNSVANQIAIVHNAQGPNLTICTACSSGTHSIGQAFDTIRRGRAKIMIAGGTDSPIMRYNFLGFDKLSVMSRRNDNPESASRPFDKDRDGFVMGEGAAVLILESFDHALARKADIYAEIKGYSVTSGAYHIVMPRPDAIDVARAMRLCLNESAVTPKDVDYINAHGTSTIANDKAEAKAIVNVFKEDAQHIPVSSTKSMIGHTLGAAGAIEAAVCALTIISGKMHATVNLETPDEDCRLNHIMKKHLKRNVDIALSNSFGFGNNNACLLFSKM